MSLIKKEVTKEELIKIISLCEAIEAKGIDPFSVNIKELLAKLRKILSEFKDLDLIILDAETLYKIAVVISLQHAWLKERISSLLIDSQIVLMKIMSMDKKDIAEAFARAWRPIVSMEQITTFRFMQGMEYFLMLPPRADRKRGLDVSRVEPSIVGMDDVKRAQILMEHEIEKLHEECLRMVNERGEVDYWEFIKADSFKEMVWRAYIVSFMVSSGLAEIVKNPITNTLKIKPYREKVKLESPRSLVVTISSGGEDGRG